MPVDLPRATLAARMIKLGIWIRPLINLLRLAALRRGQRDRGRMHPVRSNDKLGQPLCRLAHSLAPAPSMR